jgi:hypothetical protein
MTGSAPAIVILSLALIYGVLPVIGPRQLVGDGTGGRGHGEAKWALKSSSFRLFPRLRLDLPRGLHVRVALLLVSHDSVIFIKKT